MPVPSLPDPKGAVPVPATVVVIGSINADMVARCEALPRPGETVTGSSFSVEPGGKGANQAVAAARIGATVAMVGCIGNDNDGNRLLEALVREGIDCKGVARDDSHPTGVALISVAESAENCIVVVPGANHRVTVSHVEAVAPVFANARLVVAQLETPIEATVAAFELARRAGANTVLNAAPAAAALPRSLLSLVDWLVVNETEAETLAGHPPAGSELAGRAATVLLAAGVGAVIITLGSRGVLLATAEGFEHFPAVPVRAVDTTGAGDTFVGVFCASLARGESVKEAIGLGQAAAAIAVTRHGAQAAMPRRSELLASSAQAATGVQFSPTSEDSLEPDQGHLRHRPWHRRRDGAVDAAA